MESFLNVCKTFFYNVAKQLSVTFKQPLNNLLTTSNRILHYDLDACIFNQCKILTQVKTF